jgi:hypothetical protein
MPDAPTPTGDVVKIVTGLGDLSAAKSPASPAPTIKISPASMMGPLNVVMA